jgi:hypothetical protein
VQAQEKLCEARASVMVESDTRLRTSRLQILSSLSLVCVR